jgi:hypothetical protein
VRPSTRRQGLLSLFKRVEHGVGRRLSHLDRDAGRVLHRGERIVRKGEHWVEHEAERHLVDIMLAVASPELVLAHHELHHLEHALHRLQKEFVKHEQLIATALALAAVVSIWIPGVNAVTLGLSIAADALAIHEGIKAAKSGKYAKAALDLAGTGLDLWPVTGLRLERVGSRGLKQVSAKYANFTEGTRAGAVTRGLTRAERSQVTSLTRRYGTYRATRDFGRELPHKTAEIAGVLALVSALAVPESPERRHPHPHFQRH